MVAQDDLLRFAKLGDGRIAPDRERRAPGRGAYLHPVEECLRTAEKRHSLERALGGSLSEGWVNSVVRT